MYVMNWIGQLPSPSHFESKFGPFDNPGIIKYDRNPIITDHIDHNPAD